MTVWAVIGALVIGVSLGLTGAGGSILTFPVLVYFAGMDPRDAVAASLFVVGITAAVGAGQRAAMGHVHPGAAGWFALSGVIGAVVGARFTHLVSPGVLVLLFSGLMFAVGIRTWLGKSEVSNSMPDCKPARCFLAGAGVGVLTGFLGVGGGFLLLPALTRFARLPVPVAAGTSLAIIAVNALGGFLGHIRHAEVDWLLVILFAAICVAAVLTSGRIAGRLDPRLVRRVFAVVVLLTAVGSSVSVFMGAL